MILNTVFALAGLLTICVTPALGQGTGGAGGGHTWLGTSSTDFFDTANWNTGFWPNGIAVYGPDGGANTTIDRSNQTYTYQYGIQFTNTTDANGNYTLSGTQAYSIQNYGISTEDMTSGTLNEVINPNITNNVGSYNIGLNHDLTLNGIISSPQDVVKNGVGTMTLNGINTYVSDTIINAGTLKLGNNSALGSTTAGTTVNDGATLQLNHDGWVGDAITINGAGDGGNGAIWSTNNGIAGQGPDITGVITLGSDATIRADTRIDHANEITDGGNGYTLTKTGTGNIVRSSTLSVGNLVIDQGQYLLTGAAAAGSAGQDIEVNSGGEFAFWKNFSVTSTPDLSLNDGSSYSVYSNTNDQTSGINGTMALNGTVTFKNQNHQHTVSSDISGSGILKLQTVANANGSYTFDGNNTYSSVTEVGTGGATTGKVTLTAGSTSAFSNNSDFQVSANSTLSLAGNSNTIGSLGDFSGAGGVVENDNASAATLTVGDNDNNTTFSGLIRDGAGAGALSLTKIGTGTLILASSSNHGYGGATTINGGTLELQSTSGFRGYTGGDININNGSTLRFSVNGGNGYVLDAADTINFDSNGGGLMDVASGNFVVRGSTITTAGGAENTINGSFNMDSGGPATFDVASGTDAVDLTVNALLGNTQGITKQGAGTMELTANNTYTGLTTVSGGTLIINGDHSAATGGINVTGTGTLAGSGSIGGTATIGLGGILSPGNSPGTQTFDNLVWENGGTYLWEINADSLNGGSGTQGADPGWDWISVTSDWDISGITTGFNIDITSLTGANDAGLADGFDYSGKSYLDPFETFTVLSFGTFDDTFDASLFSLNDSAFLNPKVGWSLEISGNDLVLNAVFVPEPSSAALLGLGGLALMLRRKRSAA